MPFPLYPPMFILVNNDLTDNVKNYIVRQLKIDDVFNDGYIDGYLDGYFIENNVVIPDKRIMVLKDLRDMTNRDFYDAVFFVKAGMITILKSKRGPGQKIFPVLNVTWQKFGF